MSHAVPTVAEIEAMDLEALRTCWRSAWGEPPPLRSVPILRMLLAWRVQTAAGEGLAGEVRAAIRRKGAIKAEGLDLGIGAKLARNWKGTRIEVIVEPDGFNWEGRRYKSLSAVATAIAGTRWNGPRFFGLRQQP
jgi:hypothetical protein